MRPRALTRSARTVAAGAALVGLVLSTAACNPGRPPAATVEGVDISADTLDALLAAYIDADPENFRDRIQGDGEGTYRMAAAAELLNGLVLQVAQSHLAEREGADPTEEETAEAEELVRNGFAQDAAVAPDAEPTEEQAAAQEASAAAFEDLPADVRTLLVDLRADTLALARVTAERSGTQEEAARAVYEADPSAFDRLCIRAIVLGSEDDLPAVQERLAAGEEFGAVSADVSISEEIAAAEGALGECYSATDLVGQQLLPQEIVQLVAPLEVGEVSEPYLPGDGSVAIFDLSERQPVPFEEALPVIQATLPDPGEAALAELVQGAIGDLDISIDPRFGTWEDDGTITPPDGARDPEGADDEGLPGAAQPTVPPTAPADGSGG